jgi:hypothetical protein
VGLEGSPAVVGSPALALGSSAPELELELLLESSPGSLGGGCVGNGCWAAASDGVVVFGLGESGGILEGLGESGGFFGLLGSPGNGNCSAVEAGFLAAGAGGAQGFAVGVVWAV